MTRLWMTSARVAGLLLLALTSTATPAYTQSLFNAAGLGTPVDALDGRARALGSIGTVSYTHLTLPTICSV